MDRSTGIERGLRDWMWVMVSMRDSFDGCVIVVDGDGDGDGGNDVDDDGGRATLFASTVPGQRKCDNHCTRWVSGSGGACDCIWADGDPLEANAEAAAAAEDGYGDGVVADDGEETVLEEAVR